jgi:hypothetical protein
MVLGSLRRSDSDEDLYVNKMPTVIQEDPRESAGSKDIMGSDGKSEEEVEIVSFMKSVSLNQNPENPVNEKSLENTDSDTLMMRKGSSRYVPEPLVQNALDMTLSPKRSILKPGDVNAPFIALNPPILPIIDNDSPSSVYLAPGVAKGPEQQRHVNQRIDAETEEDPW